MLNPMRAKVVKRKYAELHLDRRNVDMRLVDEIKTRFPDAVDILDKWVLFADVKYLDTMQPLIDFVQVEYQSIDNVLYRGFNLRGIQNNLGLKRSGLFKSASKLDIGEVQVVKIDAPVSFTTDPVIAADFGSHIVEVRSYDSSDVFPISDELLYIINEKRNLLNRNRTMIGQGEVIVLPGKSPLEIELISSTGKKGLVDKGITLESLGSWSRW